MNRTVESPATGELSQPDRPLRRGARRRVVLGLAALALVTGGIVCLALTGAREAAFPTLQGRPPTAPLAHARYDALAFLTRYMDADGRVVRRDQGWDTVSEGQAYAMLLAVAIGDRRAFDLAWRWDAANLALADHLSSYHWQGGVVVGRDPATDADLDMAWALVLAGRRFHDPAYRNDGLQMGSAVLASETVTVGGKLELVAGPWARNSPYEIDPSYFAPEAMSALDLASSDQRWAQLRHDADALVYSLERGTTSVQLPPDWAVLSADGRIAPAGAPSSQSAPAYGLDAQRVPVWYAASCSTSERAAASAT